MTEPRAEDEFAAEVLPALDWVEAADTAVAREVQVRFTSPALRTLFEEIQAAHAAGLLEHKLAGPTVEQLLRGRHARDPEDSPHTPRRGPSPGYGVLDEYARLDAAQTLQLFVGRGAGKSLFLDYETQAEAWAQAYSPPPRYPWGLEGHVHDETCPPGWDCPLTDVAAETNDYLRRSGDDRRWPTEEDPVKLPTPAEVPAGAALPPVEAVREHFREMYREQAATADHGNKAVTHERMPQPEGRTPYSRPRPGARKRRR